MFFKLIADTFSVSRDSDHFMALKALKKPKTEDQLWVALEIVGDGKFARATSQSILETLEAVFFDHMELGAYERFEAALKETNLIINNLKEKRGKGFGKINAILAAFTGQELHLTQSNDAEAYLIRNGKLSLVSEGLSSRSADLFVNIASGELRGDDKMIFATGRLLRLATHSQLVQMFSDGVTEAVEALKEVAMGDEEQSLGAVCIHAKLLQKPDAPLQPASSSPLWAKIKDGLENAVAFVSEKTGNRLSSVNKKSILIVLALVVVVLAGSVYTLMGISRNKAIAEEHKAKLNRLYQEVQVANTKGYANDKAGANEILEKIDTDARAILDTQYFRAETLALLDKVQEVRDSINHTDRLKEVAPFIDLKTKKPDAKAIGLVSLNDNLYAFGYNTMFEIILDQVLDPKKIDDTEIVLAGATMEDQKVIALLTQSGRVMEFENGVMRFANTEDNAWKTGGVDVAAYGKNIYILNPKNNQIYKYSRLRGKYSSAMEYNSDANIQDGISFAIEGDIYVLKKGGDIVRIYKSKAQPFKIEDL
ncbi:hypothetical protein HZA44_02665, partial [Candidatus Peregrinibacteria bacterium]|nr:hypothetical protein [Candidatus Peregrinibacteria bacterium]